MFSLVSFCQDNPSLCGWLCAQSGRGLTLYGDIAVPQSNNHADYINLIGRLPNIDTPGLFALPDNIERSVQVSHGLQMLKQELGFGIWGFCRRVVS